LADSILHRVAAGDSAAVNECLERYGGLVWSLARRFAKRGDDAEDAAQDVFIELWKKAERFDPSIASEMTFVAMIARRRLIDRSRRKQRTVITGVLEDEPASREPDRGQARVDVCDEAERAARALAQLKPDQQRVLKLSIYDGLSHEQIAKAIQMPLGTVKTHARRGLAKLRDMLGVERVADAEGAGS
jgi:RNA polymerase sigma-70 factor (ECF subfamily)